jgi:hypothetical protein
MREVLSFGAFIISLLCLTVFVVSLKPDAIKAVHAPSKPDYCSIGLSSAQECGLNVSAAVPGHQR